LFDAVEAAEGFLAVLFDVVVEHFELGGDVFHGSGEADYGITCFVTAATETHRAHSGHADGGSSNSSEDLDHGYSLAALAPAGFLAASPWSAVLAVADAGGFWWPGLVVNPGGASLGFDGHQNPLLVLLLLNNTVSSPWGAAGCGA